MCTLSPAFELPLDRAGNPDLDKARSLLSGRAPKLPRSGGWSDGLHALLASLLSVDPAKRPAVDAAVSTAAKLLDSAVVDTKRTADGMDEPEPEAEIGLDGDAQVSEWFHARCILYRPDVAYRHDTGRGGGTSPHRRYIWLPLLTGRGLCL
jgi:hypothetical protein